MRILLLFLLGLLSGCVAYVHSPPGRSFPLESSKALYKRETGVQLEAGGGIAADVAVPGFNLRVRHGIVDKLDGSFELGYQRIRTSPSSVANSDRNIGTGRLGIKYEIIEQIAVTAGVGGGIWAGGGFVSPDASLIFAWENPYCVPFIDGGAYTSHPIRAQSIRIVGYDFGNAAGEVFNAAPVFTYGWTAGLGLRIPVVREVARKTAPAVLLGMRFRGAYWENQPEFNRTARLGRVVYWYGSVGFEYVFAARRTQQN